MKGRKRVGAVDISIAVECLKLIAGRLASAPADTEARARAHAEAWDKLHPTSTPQAPYPWPYQAGALSKICTSAAAEIGLAIKALGAKP